MVRFKPPAFRTLASSTIPRPMTNAATGLPAITADVEERTQEDDDNEQS